MSTYMLLQHYWWFIISLLGAILVFLLFVQGGQGLLYRVGRTPEERNLIVNVLGRKWEFTFTTLVTFGGAFFASFPLFYSTSFGGAFYVWMLILFVFVIQAVAYEFRRKPNNFLGEKTYEWFLMINGVVGALLLGVAVGTFFTGANFSVDLMNITAIESRDIVISQWTTPWRGLEAVTDYRNLALGLAVLFLSRVLALQYFLNSIDNEDVIARSRKLLLCNAVPFVMFFLLFVISLMFSKGWGVNYLTGDIGEVPYKYLQNFLKMPIILIMFLLGVVSVLWGIFSDYFRKTRNGIWFSGIGTVVTVLSLLLIAGFNHTAYYPSLTHPQSSLTIYNSSSSEFTLTAMSIVSIMIPFVVAYIWYAWRSMNKKRITTKEIDEDDHSY